MVLYVLIWILLLAVHVSREVKCDSMLLKEPVDGINSENVVSTTNLCTSQSALRSSMRTINDRGPSRSLVLIDSQDYQQNRMACS